MDEGQRKEGVQQQGERRRFHVEANVPLAPREEGWGGGGEVGHESGRDEEEREGASVSLTKTPNNGSMMEIFVCHLQLRFQNVFED